MSRPKKEKVDKSLLAFLEKSNPETLIYLGSKDGSNWLAIDTAENLIKEVDLIDNYHRKLIEMYYSRCVTVLERTPKSIVDVQEKLTSGKLDEKDTAKYEQKKENLYRSLVSSYNGKLSNGKILAKWKPFKELEIIETYANQPTHVDDKGVCVLIKSDINGKFWSKEEYKTFKEYELKMGSKNN